MLLEVLVRTTLLDKEDFGLVYKGLLYDGSIVAIKRLQFPLPHFVQEIQNIAQVHHKHLVNLIGYCEENQEQLLVYEYLSYGNVGDHLYGHEFTESGQLSGQYTVRDGSFHAVNQMMELALTCLDIGVRRPSMEIVVQELERIRAMEMGHLISDRIEEIGNVTLGSELFK